MHSLLVIQHSLSEALGPDLIPGSRILPGVERQGNSRPESMDLKSDKCLKRLWDFVNMALKSEATKILEFVGHGLCDLEVEISEILMTQAIQS